jgi:exosortase
MVSGGGPFPRFQLDFDAATHGDRVRAELGRLAGLTAIGAILLWSYWPTLAVMADKWQTDPQYSHGYLVPAFAATLLWLRRSRIKEVRLVPSPTGLALIALGIALHLAGGRYYLDSLDMISLLPVLAGLCLCLGGRPALAWAWPSIAFLAFMLPLPHRVETALSHPLRRLATYASTYTLQTLGFAAVADGNTIHLGEPPPLSVEEACSGLGMLVTFFAVTTAVVLVIRRRPLDRILLLLSTVPIALVANVIRITMAGILHATLGIEDFHDSLAAGLLTMSLAVGLLWLEIWLLSRLLLEPEVYPHGKSFLSQRPGPGRGTQARLPGLPGMPLAQRRGFNV